ncbi:hypothetical protein P5G65_10820 [Paenibacillus chondroitinus]|uniref:Ig-like domain-containing protein n=1 Tax=Paenibacillus chondroitinus TaxID=59842 RepID=A0ABU6DAE1_9BACL|nr:MULTISPECIES: Ig-like domain repeat protein [Paenibacillus]MCY9656741.1 DUF5011 domain-containing protein [Paenibacillus anseongense]MEB4794390.1 hypothetical protein [Paenibacillus chondroitinus]
MRKWTLSLLSLLMFFSLSLQIASASPAEVTASLDTATGIVTVSGNSGLTGEHLITVQVRDPHNRLAYLDQGQSSANGDYLFHFTVNTSFAGSYAVSVAGDADIAVSQTAFTVNSLDTTAPVTTAVASPVDGSNGWYVSAPTVTLSATDNVSVTQTTYRLNGGAWSPYVQPVTLPEISGSYLFEYKSIDQAGNEEAVHSLTLRLDKEAPSIKVTLDQDTIWPPNKKMVTVTADVYATDAISQIDSIVLTSITCNDSIQPSDIQDAQFGTLDKTFALRAEKSNEHSERVYTITYTATDTAGNRSTAAATVTVPHDQSGKTK